MKNKLTSQSGLTMVELIIAMFVSSVVIMGVFYLWNHLNRHVALSKNKTQLEVETDRIGGMIAATIRKTTNVIDWNERRIELINPNGTDTIIYYFNNSDLLKNGLPVTILLPGAKVTDFRLTDLNEFQNASDKSVLLDMVLTIENVAKESSTAHYTVQFAGISKSNSKSESEWGL